MDADRSVPLWPGGMTPEEMAELVDEIDQVDARIKALLTPEELKRRRDRIMKAVNDRIMAADDDS